MRAGLLQVCCLIDPRITHSQMQSGSPFPAACGCWQMLLHVGLKAQQLFMLAGLLCTGFEPRPRCRAAAAKSCCLLL